MTNEELIAELQKKDPKAPVIIEDFDRNFELKIIKVDYYDGNVVIIGDEQYE